MANDQGPHIERQVSSGMFLHVRHGTLLLSNLESLGDLQSTGALHKTWSLGPRATCSGSGSLRRRITCSRLCAVLDASDVADWQTRPGERGDEYESVSYAEEDVH